MEEVIVDLDGKKIKVVTKLSKEMIEDNTLKIELDDTIDLSNLKEEVKNDPVKE